MPASFFPTSSLKLGLLALVAALLLTGCPELEPRINLQGNLTDSMGAPVDDGDYEMIVRFWSAETGGTMVHEQTHNVSVQGGLFSVDITEFPAHVFSSEIGTNHDTLYWEAEVEGETLAPRRAMSGAPFAHALVAGSAAIGARPDEGNVTDDGFPAVFTALNTEFPTNNPGYGMMALSTNAGLYVDNLRGDGEFGPSDSPEHNPDIILGGRYLSGPDGGTAEDTNHAGVIATEPDESFSGMFLRSNYRLELFKSYSNEHWSLPEFRVYHGQRDPDHLQMRLDNDGDLSIEGNYSSGGADFAERIAVEDPGLVYEEGDVLVISADQDRAVALSDEPNSTRVIGVYSANPGFIGGVGTAGEQVRRERAAYKAAGIDPDSEAEVAAARVTRFELNGEKIDVAIAGIVPVKVTDENGPILRGDLLTTAYTPGHAMKAINPQLGTIVGKAMGELVEGEGMIEMFVMAQ
ncbi:hypothetical protein [Wenzhouxiangella sp. AB-CW3]|uniref:hypothetical protein n=1 Tax=Wenzhouxiangella sp. AB-CW3 TaxID=2771012 RepID=UPI001CC2B687|nr:hypothetical protein [Wenzhouxiangella sp. AB-CW3]